MKDEGLFGRGGKKGAGAEAWKKAEGGKAEGGKVEGAVAVIQQHTQRKKEGRRWKGRDGKAAKGVKKAKEGKKAEGVVAVIQQHTQREREPWLWMEREQIIMLL